MTSICTSAKEGGVEIQIFFFPHLLENEIFEVWNLSRGFQVLKAEFKMGNLKEFDI